MAVSKTPAKRRPNPKKRIGRLGRPPREAAGEVDERILDAARQVFLERGLEGASIDEIARLAPASKPTIYARYPSKQALLMAVGLRNSAGVVARFESAAPAGGTVEERLASVASNLLRGLLSSDAVDLMRLSAGEARRFPELANIGRTSRERAVRAVGQVLADIAESVGDDAYPALAPKRIGETTWFFVDLVVARFLLRALFGESREKLCTEIDGHVSRAVPFFLAACRSSDAG
jgi:AcrR family transcriptional regulator